MYERRIVIFWIEDVVAKYQGKWERWRLSAWKDISTRKESRSRFAIPRNGAKRHQSNCKVACKRSADRKDPRKSNNQRNGVKRWRRTSNDDSGSTNTTWCWYQKAHNTGWIRTVMRLLWQSQSAFTNLPGETSARHGDGCVTCDTVAMVSEKISSSHVV